MIVGQAKRYLHLSMFAKTVFVAKCLQSYRLQWYSSSLCALWPRSSNQLCHSLPGLAAQSKHQGRLHSSRVSQVAFGKVALSLSPLVCQTCGTRAASGIGRWTMILFALERIHWQQSAACTWHPMDHRFPDAALFQLPEERARAHQRSWPWETQSNGSIVGERRRRFLLDRECTSNN